MCAKHISSATAITTLSNFGWLAFGYKMVGGKLRTPFVCSSVGVGIRLKGWSAHGFAIMGSSVEEVVLRWWISILGAKIKVRCKSKSMRNKSVECCKAEEL